jgi:hypothetical protein
MWMLHNILTSKAAEAQAQLICNEQNFKNLLVDDTDIAHHS